PAEPFGGPGEHREPVVGELLRVVRDALLAAAEPVRQQHRRHRVRRRGPFRHVERRIQGHVLVVRRPRAYRDHPVLGAVAGRRGPAPRPARSGYARGVTAPVPSLTLTACLRPAALDARRGVVRLHQEVFTALGLRPGDAVTLTSRRATAGVAALAEAGASRALL